MGLESGFDRNLKSALNSKSRNRAAAVINEVHTENASRKHDSLMSRLGAMTGKGLHQHRPEVKTKQGLSDIEVSEDNVSKREEALNYIENCIDEIRTGDSHIDTNIVIGKLHDIRNILEGLKE